MTLPIFDFPAETVEPTVSAGSARRFSSVTTTPGVPDGWIWMLTP